MSKRIKPVTRDDFELLIKFAKLLHLEKDEPIPMLAKDNWDRLDSCLQTPFQVVFGQVCYRGLIKKAAALFYFLVKNHPLANGNKRMACLTMGYFLAINSHSITIDDEGLIELARYTANSDPADQEQCFKHIASVVRKFITRID